MERINTLIIRGIPYVGISEELTCSMSACLTMLFQYYGRYITPEEVADMFGHAFLSSGFRDWNQEHKNAERYAAGEMLACAQYLIDSRFPGVVSDIITTDIPKINLSYIKRDIPVIITGRFPLLSGNIPNTVLIKGYVDEYVVVNDPRGNAMSGYRDKLGENMLYESSLLSLWTGKTRVHILRILSN